MRAFLQCSRFVPRDGVSPVIPRWVSFQKHFRSHKKLICWRPRHVFFGGLSLPHERKALVPLSFATLPIDAILSVSSFRDRKGPLWVAIAPARRFGAVTPAARLTPSGNDPNQKKSDEMYKKIVCSIWSSCLSDRLDFDSFLDSDLYIRAEGAV